MEWSDAVGDSDADQPQMLLRPPAPFGGYYEPVTAEGTGAKEQATSQPLARPLLIPSDVRRLTTPPAELDSFGGRRPLTPPLIPLAKCGDGVTVAS